MAAYRSAKGKYGSLQVSQGEIWQPTGQPRGNMAAYRSAKVIAVKVSSPILSHIYVLYTVHVNEQIVMMKFSSMLLTGNFGHYLRLGRSFNRAADKNNSGSDFNSE